MRTKPILLVAVMLLALTLSACGPTVAAPQAITRTLMVNGSGTVYLTPDIAYIFIGVHTENADISEAVTSNNTQAQRVVDALRNMGVEAKDIQTSNFSVWSSQQYDPMTGEYTGVIYMVDNTVYVTVRDLSKPGELLDAAIGAGANNINSIQFDVADKTEALTQARQLAVDNAEALADELAAAAGVQLGEIQTIAYTDYPMYGYGMGGGGGAQAAPSVPMPINPGQMQLTVTVSITFEIK